MEDGKEEEREKREVYDRITLIYILAASHSGSTLLTMLLNSHPDVCTVGELKATSLGDPERYRCSCHELIKNCSFWQGIQQDMAAKGYEFDITDAGTDIRTGMSPYVLKLLRPLHRRRMLETIRDGLLYLSPVWRKNISDILNRNLALVQSVTKRTGTRVIVDSSKIGIRLKYLRKIPSLDIKVIRATRDGRGVALTYVDPAEYADASDPSLRQGGLGGDRSAERLSMEQAAREWLRANEEAEAVLANLDPEQHTMSRYEDLCNDPKGAMSRLFSFIGVDPDKANGDFRAVEHHVVGNGMRLDSQNEIQLDERWRTALSPDDIEIFNSIAGSMLHKLGYEQ